MFCLVLTLTKLIKRGDFIWKGKKTPHLVFRHQTKIAVKIIFSLYEPRMPEEKKKACFLSRCSLYFISFWENGNISEFLLIFLSYIIKKGKMNHKISFLSFLHERRGQKSHVDLSRGSLLLWFARWSLHFSNWTWSGGSLAAQTDRIAEEKEAHL